MSQTFHIVVTRLPENAHRHRVCRELRGSAEEAARRIDLAEKNGMVASAFEVAVEGFGDPVASLLCSTGDQPSEVKRELEYEAEQGLRNLAFSLVREEQDWKARIDKVVTDAQLREVGGLDFVLYCVVFFTATSATACVMRPGLRQITAAGYRAGPAGP